MKVFFTSVSALLGMAVGRASAHEDGLNHLLLEKAMPLEEYESQLIASGGKAFSHKLGLGSDESTRRRKLGNAYYAGDDASNYTGYSAGGDDDYFQIDKAINFNGYALKYATCQKVQRYSVTAVQRGQYSSMVTDDVVILRLCPKRSCNTNSRYGCMSGYGEYAMDVSEYMTIVMKYQANKEETFCSFCNSCAASSSYANYFDDDLYANQTASNAYQSSNSDACYTYSTQCSNVLNSCNNNDDDNSTSVDYDAMQGYFGCQAKDDYYVSPHCDPRTGTIEMGIFYDNHCAQDAGDSVSVSNFLGDDFDTDVFASSQEDVLCLDCSASVSCFKKYSLVLVSQILHLSNTLTLFSFPLVSNMHLFTIPRICFVIMSTRTVDSATKTLHTILERYILMITIITMQKHKMSIHVLLLKASVMEHMMPMVKFMLAAPNSVTSMVSLLEGRKPHC